MIKIKPRRSEVYLSCGAGNDSVLADYSLICVRVSFMIKIKPRRSEVYLSCDSAGNDSVLADYSLICVRVSFYDKIKPRRSEVYLSCGAGNDSVLADYSLICVRVSFYDKIKPRRSEVYLSCDSAGNDSVLSYYRLICVRVRFYENKTPPERGLSIVRRRQRLSFIILPAYLRTRELFNYGDAQDILLALAIPYVIRRREINSSISTAAFSAIHTQRYIQHRQASTDKSLRRLHLFTYRTV